MVENPIWEEKVERDRMEGEGENLEAQEETINNQLMKELLTEEDQETKELEIVTKVRNQLNLEKMGIA